MAKRLLLRQLLGGYCAVNGRLHGEEEQRAEDERKKNKIKKLRRKLSALKCSSQLFECLTIAIVNGTVNEANDTLTYLVR